MKPLSPALAELAKRILARRPQLGRQLTPEEQAEIDAQWARFYNPLDDAVKTKVANLSLPEGWAIATTENLSEGDDTVLRVDLGTTVILKRGPRKGKRVIDKVFRWLLITQADLAAALARFEATTGNCHQCGGSGRMLYGFDLFAVEPFLVCARCNGSGRAPGSNKKLQ